MFKEFNNGIPSSLTKIVADSPLGIGFFDDQGHWLLVNPSLIHLLGFSEEEFSNGCFLDIFPNYSIVQKNQAILETLLNKKSASEQHEEVLVKKDGTEIWVSITYSLLNRNGTSAVFSVQIHDLTDQKRTKEYLRYSDQLSSAGQLAAGIAHEVKNPLTAIKGFVQLMLRNGNTDDYLKIINQEVTRMESMLNEFLLLGKPQESNLKPIDFTNMIYQVVNLLQSQAIMREISIELHVDRELPEVVCDESRIKQVFINLIKNAIEATQDAGTIDIHTFVNQTTVTTVIKDQGPGIPAEDIPKLGRPFFSTKPNGTGLGLMTCFTIIKEHYGHIDFTSDSTGTTVTVELPNQPQPNFLL